MRLKRTSPSLLSLSAPAYWFALAAQFTFAQKPILIMQLIYIVFVLASSVTSFPFSVNSLRTAVAQTTLHHVVRQVGNGVKGNQTGNNGSTGGTGLGDGKGVGFAGTGNDIDTGKFDHMHPLHLPSLSP
jgi:hypothetical protein